jgi:hypothetical protein
MSDDISGSEVDALFSLLEVGANAWNGLSDEQQEQALGTVTEAFDENGGVVGATDEKSEFQRNAETMTLVGKALRVGGLLTGPGAVYISTTGQILIWLGKLGDKLTPERTTMIADALYKHANGVYMWLCKHPYALVGAALFGGSPSAALSTAVDLNKGAKFYLLGNCPDGGRGSFEVPGQTIGIDDDFDSESLAAALNRGSESSDSGGGAGISGGAVFSILAILGGVAAALRR